MIVCKTPPALSDELTSSAPQTKQVFQPQYPPLTQETRTHVSTDHAAYLLGRRPQTMRVYAMTGHPIRPVRFNGRLAWPISEIKRVLGLEA
jgi:hypothetical protein